MEETKSKEKSKTYKYWSFDEKGRKAEDFIKNECSSDVNSWMILLREAQTREIQDARILFEKAMVQFPGCYRFLKHYLDMETKNGDNNHLNQLYERYLPMIPNVDLHQSYLNFIHNTRENDHNFAILMLEAFEFCVDKVGFDYLSYPIWNSYINFLKNTEAVGTYAEGQKVIQIRKLFYRILAIPMANIDQVWKDYCAFEQGVNKASSDKIAADRLKDFLAIKKSTKDFECFLKGIIRTSIPMTAQNSPNEKTQFDLWQKYVNWEKSNPLVLEESFLLAKRVIYAYEQFIQNFMFHTCVWIETTQYIERFHRKLISEGDQNHASLLENKCRELYRRGVNGPMNDSVVFHFCYSDFEEIFQNYSKCIEIFKKLLTFKDADHSTIYINYMKHSFRTLGLEESRKIFSTARSDQRTDYRVYSFAAEQEFILHQNTISSLKIYELAIKRFPSSFGLLKSYISHLRKVHDQNLVRTSFERLLHMFDSKYSEYIFQEFHKFESTNGLINSYLAIEDRIDEKFQVPYASLRLVANRYGILKIESQSESKNIKSCDTKNSKIEPPDVTQMRPFKPLGPKSFIPTLPSFINGGVFPPPPKVADLISKLPPPNTFIGPMINIEPFIYHLSNMLIDENLLGIKNDDNPNENIPAEEIFNENQMIDDIYKFRQQKTIA